MKVIAIIIILIYLTNVSSFLRAHKRTSKISRRNPFYEKAFDKFKKLLGREYYFKVLFSKDGIHKNSHQLRYVYMLFCLINNNMQVELKPTTTPISKKLIGYMFNEEKDEKKYFPSVLYNYFSFVDFIQKYLNPKAKFFNKIKQSLKYIPLKWYSFDKSNFKDLSVEDAIVSLKMEEETINCKSPIIFPNVDDINFIWFIYFGTNHYSTDMQLRFYNDFNLKLKVKDIHKEVFKAYANSKTEFILLCKD